MRRKLPRFSCPHPTSAQILNPFLPTDVVLFLMVGDLGYGTPALPVDEEGVDGLDGHVHRAAEEPQGYLRRGGSEAYGILDQGRAASSEKMKEKNTGSATTGVTPTEKMRPLTGILDQLARCCLK
jgi:hypothetical protein